MIFYTPMGKPITPDMRKINAKKVIAYWFNPRDGHTKKIGEYNATEKIEFKPWSVGRGSDFVLIIMNKKANYQIPGINNTW